MIMKNILYIGGFDLPDNNAAAQRVIANSKILRDLGYNVLLVGLTSDNANANNFFNYDGLQCINIPYPHNPVQWIKYLTSIRQYKKFWVNTTPDVVIAYNHPAVALSKLIKYCHQHGAKVISDCTEWYEPHGSWLFKKIKGWDINKRMYDVHCRVDGIITISRYLDDFYRSKGMNTVLLPPLVDIQAKKWDVKRYNDNFENKRLVYAGSPLGKKDRLDWIISSLSKIDSIVCGGYELEVIGITKEQYMSIYAQDGKGIPQYVTFLGRISHEEVIDHLLRSDFQIFLREQTLPNMAGFPTKFAESISSQTLVLTNDTSNLMDYLENGKNGFVLNIENEETLTDSLLKPLSLPLKEVRTLCSKIDNSVFDYRRFAPKLKDFHEVVMK